MRIDKVDATGGWAGSQVDARYAPARLQIFSATVTEIVARVAASRRDSPDLA